MDFSEQCKHGYNNDMFLPYSYLITKLYFNIGDDVNLNTLY